MKNQAEAKLELTHDKDKIREEIQNSLETINSMNEELLKTI